MAIGIERVGFYGGRASLDVGTLAASRGLNSARFANLLMRRKSLSLPWEDPVSFAVNAARPVVDAMTKSERTTISTLIVATESGVDWGKSMATYVHRHLGLAPQCRLFEVKQACYGGTAGLQLAAALVGQDAKAEARVLVISTDLGRPVPHSYAEPSQGSAAEALLVSRNPTVFALEPGASGIHAFEVMDACRPTPEIETGDADLSLLTYLDCIEKSFLAYRAAVGPIDLREHFAYLACHTPFGGMVKGAHRTLMRKICQVPPPVIETDFEQRVRPSLSFCQEVGNIYSGTVFLALLGVLEGGDFAVPRRIGLFSYGSGCCSEFFSGIADAAGQRAVQQAGIGAALAARRALSMIEYEAVLPAVRNGLIGTRNATVTPGDFTAIWQSHFAGSGLLVLDRIENYQRLYRWA